MLCTFISDVRCVSARYIYDLLSRYNLQCKEIVTIGTLCKTSYVWYISYESGDVMFDVGPSSQ